MVGRGIGEGVSSQFAWHRILESSTCSVRCLVRTGERSSPLGGARTCSVESSTCSVQCLVRTGERFPPLGVGPYLLGGELYPFGAAPSPNEGGVLVQCGRLKAVVEVLAAAL